MKTNCWILGGAKGTVGKALFKLSRDVPNWNFHFLSRDDFHLGVSEEYPDFSPGDAVIDLIPGDFPADSVGMTDDEYHQRFTEPHAQLLKYLANFKLGRLIYFSSGGTVYGLNHDRPIWKETDSVQPISAYGQSKVLLETEVAHSPEHVIFRVGNIFDTDALVLRPKGVCNKFLRMVARDEELTIFGSLENSKEYISNEDVARAILLALNSKVTGIFNLGTGVPFSLDKMIASIESALEKKAKVNVTAANANDVSWFCLDVSKARDQLGFKPQDDLFQWIASQKGKDLT